MVLEAGKITEEGIKRLRERIGSFNRPRQYGEGLFNEYASRDVIRHFCQGIGDPNPPLLGRRVRPPYQILQHHCTAHLPL